MNRLPGGIRVAHGWRRYLCGVSVLAALAAPLPVQAAGLIEFSDSLLKKVEKRYGKSAVLRLNALADLVRKNGNISEMDKVEKVNGFFNMIPYYTDWAHWKKKDYWATPFEKLTTHGGDCEDYALAKYFTLKELGVPEKKMRIMYVKALRWNEAHMVLTYFPNPDDIPLVLDNLNPRILPAHKRKDLVPVYSFNGDGLWLAKGRGTGKRVGGSGKLKLWVDVNKRFNQ
ncbi:transglutaminase-like cysteine peptidase [Neptuniibacter halophilus]|uniref:transglutaminase-like cysteine peptidase n=1 Tax=Neptuniibacter halophilus TaxID=651666 RepID=UPI002574372D|nr:transglutaminase-like cysteine peptidase [Neptuniibacter halophilus]